MKTIKTLAAKTITPICSGLLYLIHNRNTFAFNRLELQSVQFSFSQFGEDLVIRRLAEQFALSKGIYVDAGAYHPVFGSNTLLLHKKGWRGINIDLAAERIAEFQRSRPHDDNIVACLSDKVASVEIAHYEIPSTDRVLSSNDGEKRSQAGCKPVRVSVATTITLSQVIRESSFRFEDIKYLNVDCEGHDFQVLRGLDFSRCRPQIVSIEAWNDAEQTAIGDFLARYAYRIEAIVPPTIIFTTR
jgi:FkbM family methyltransferase